MGLIWSDLLPDYKASLNDAARVFMPDETEIPADPPPDPPDDPPDPDLNFKRHLRLSAAALSREKRHRTALAEVTLVAGQSTYTDIPADLILTKVSAWPQGYVLPWDMPSGPMPSLRTVEVPEGRALCLTPAPSAAQIAKFGSRYTYYYLAEHAITDDPLTSTLGEKDLPLLMLRAQIEAMRELSFRGYAKPVTLRAGGGAGGAVVSKNQTPPALWDLLMTEYRNTP